MSRIVYRDMTEDDVAQVAAVEKRLFSRPWTAEAFLDSLSLPDTVFLVAQREDSKELLGYCGCYQSFDEGNITNVAVCESVRRQGIASALISALVNQGSQRGIRRFFLEVRISNVPAVTLYEKAGFQTVGVRKGFYAEPVEDAKIMVLE